MIIPFMVLAIENDNDREFMTRLYMQYNRLMLAEIRKIVRDRYDPEDVLQTALVKLVEKVQLLQSREERTRVNYIITTVQHTAMDALRTLKKTDIPSLDDEDWYEANWIRSDESVEETVLRRDKVGQMEKIWPLLDVKSRHLLELRYFLDMSDAEIAKEIGIKPGSVRMELSRARKKAKALLAEHCGMVDLWP